MHDVLVILASCAVGLVTAGIAFDVLRYVRLRRQMSSRACPHCGALLGRRAAATALRRRREHMRGHAGSNRFGEIYVDVCEVTCPRCARALWFYVESQVLTPSHTSPTGIPWAHRSSLPPSASASAPDMRD